MSGSVCISVLEELSMKKIVFLLCAIFIIMTFAGAGYVLFNKGSVNAGYAAIPMVFALAGIVFYRQLK